MFDTLALLRGDEDALRDAIDTLSPELYRYAVGILLSRADAADAVQNAWIALWRHRGAVRDPAALRAYLYRCTYRAAVDILRLRRFCIPPAPPETDRPLSQEMREALAHLTPAERAIVYERAVYETPYEELSARLGLKEATVRKRYQRAKEKLAAHLPPKYRKGDNE